MRDIYKIKEDLYITNDEKIEEGDYGVGFAHGIRGVGRGHYVFKHDGSKSGKLNAICDGAEKIIRTTDKALIADGVEAFEVPKQESCCTPAGQIKRYVDCKGCDRRPSQYTPEELEGFEGFKKTLRKEQEEPKQNDFLKSIEGSNLNKLFKRGSEITEKESATGEDLGKVSYIPLPEQDLPGTTNEAFKIVLDREWFLNKEVLKKKPEQNTIKEAAEYFAHNFFDMYATNNYKTLKDGFIAGAQWFSKQAEGKFSAEEVRKILWDYVKPESTSEGYFIDQYLETCEKK